MDRVALIDRMVDEYNEWLKVNNLPPESADDVILRDDLTEEQRDWLFSFIDEWERAEQRGPLVGLMS